MAQRRVVRGLTLMLALALVASGCTSSAESSGTTTAVTTTSELPVVDLAIAELLDTILSVPMAVVARRTTPEADPYESQPVEVRAHVLAEAPVARLELWAGGELTAAEDFEEPATSVARSFSWNAGPAGVHVLLVRAIDTEGRTAQSFPLWIRTVDPAEIPVVEAMGESIALPASLPGPASPAPAAAQFPPAQIGATALATVPSVHVTSDCTMDVDVEPTGGAAAVAVFAAAFGSSSFRLLGAVGTRGGRVTVPASPVPVVLYTQSFTASAAASLSAPVTVAPNPCAEGSWSGDVSLAGGKLSPVTPLDRAYLYVSADGAHWERVPTDGSFVPPDAAGRFDFSGLLPEVAPGGAVHLEAWGWRGPALIGLGRGTYTAPAPHVPGQGQGSGEGLAVGIGAPALATNSSLDWVLSGPSEGTWLTRSALLCAYDPVPLTDQGGLLMVESECDNAPLGNLPSTTFRWSPLGTATHGVWQVSALPPPAAPLLTFPGLMAFGAVPQTTPGTVDFSIEELAALVKSTNGPAPATEDPGTLDPLELQSLVGAQSQPLTLAAAIVKAVSQTSQSIVGPGGSGQSSGGQQSGEPQAGSVPAGQTMTFQLPASLGGPAPTYGSPPTGIELPKALYVRVVPMQGSTPLAAVSNTVEFDLKHVPPEPTAIIAPFEITASMIPPRLPNSSYEHCVRVVKNPFGSKNPPPGEQLALPVLQALYAQFESRAFVYENGQKVKKGLIPGATVCALEPPPPEDGDWWDAIASAVSFVKWVWDLVADLYGELKDAVVSLIVAASGCEALLPATTCNFLAGSLVSIAATWVGVPPSLPNFDQFIEGAKGDITAFAVAAAADSGYCGVAQAACDEAAEKLVDAFLDEVQKQASAFAAGKAASDGYTLLLNPAIVVVPEPAGILSPAVYEVTIKRVTESATTSCVLTGDVKGVTTWSWSGEDGWHGNEEVVGYPMAYVTKKVDVSDLAVGESKNAVLVLDTIAKWYLPGQSNLNYTSDKYKPSSWIFFLSPAVLTTSVVSLCGSASQEWPQDTKSTEPWEIPS